MDDTLEVFNRFVDHKLTVAGRLAAGECGGDYSDGSILLAALISGVAADLWPGPHMDRRRFVETWVRYGDVVLHPTRISVPLLLRRLRRKNRLAEATAREGIRPKCFGSGYSSKVLIGDDVDADESEILQACPALAVREVRDRSYPVIFYKHVRSTLVHEYHLDNRAAGTPMTDAEASVSYVNVEATAGGVSQRRIHFHFPWLSEVARSIALRATVDLPSRPLAKPAPWWLEGPPNKALHPTPAGAIMSRRG
jgi:hypothetical protein